MKSQLVKTSPSVSDSAQPLRKTSSVSEVGEAGVLDIAATDKPNEQTIYKLYSVTTE